MGGPQLGVLPQFGVPLPQLVGEQLFRLGSEGAAGGGLKDDGEFAGELGGVTVHKVVLEPGVGFIVAVDAS